jgi:hypothetical protein
LEIVRPEIQKLRQSQKDRVRRDVEELIPHLESRAETLIRSGPVGLNRWDWSISGRSRIDTVLIMYIRYR